MKSSSPVSFDSALATVLSRAPAMPMQRIPLAEAPGRVLGADIASDIDMPPVNVSAMDGFACRNDDLERPLAVIETIAAGAMPRKTVGPGQCSRIMTGAPLPQGADAVVMFEDTAFDVQSGVMTVTAVRKNRNIRYRAEDVRKGEVVMRKGALLGAPHLAVLASVGRALVPVFRQPRVGVIATGDELVEPRVKPGHGKIRNSNGPQLCAQVRDAGCVPVYFGIVKDDPTALDRVIKKALRQCDVILLSGGVSMGDFDFVPGVLRKNRIKLLFEKIAVKPGKPTIFGIAGTKRLFGMPGNPVSTFVIFEMLVKPFLYRMMGHDFSRITLRAPLATDLIVKGASRTEFRPVRFDDDGGVLLPEYHGSAHIHAYTQAQGMVAVPAGVERIGKGEMVEVRVVL
jgi:molybdopterin molybdotransferase